MTQFHFCFDSDVLAATDASSVVSFAKRQAATATFVIHGFASKENNTKTGAAYDQRLSCHRALRIARELMNAGVRPEQIREVSGLGQTDQFSFKDPKFKEFDRVAVVLAENADITPIPGGKQPAVNSQDKEAIINAARDRLLAGQYQLAADAYISFWTCGRTPTVRHAVERLNISVPDHDNDERIRDDANGQEEGLGVNTVALSNTALRSDNPIECTMGRIIDMAFHHAVIGDTDLTPALLIAPPKRGPRAAPPTPRHLAGLHLIDLAGLSACSGKNATAQDSPAFGPAGIDEPLSADPLASAPPSKCARAPQPTRLLPPRKGEKERQKPEFIVFAKDFNPRDGKLTGVDGKTLEGAGAQIVRTAGDVIQASATVLLAGTPDVFPDYEVGFMQTVLDDFTLAEYITGHHVLQKLPVPIRAAQMRGDVPVPQPWMALTASAVPNAQGEASIKTAWRMDTQFALSLNFFRPRLFEPRFDVLDTWQRQTSLAFWLMARRRGAPLDRFSVVVIDGFVYDLTQNLNFTFPGRKKGDMRKPMRDVEGLGERELVTSVGEFRTSKTSEDSADPRLAQFDVPVASEIDLVRQTNKILEPEAAPQAGDPLGGMGLLEYGRTMQKILDNLVVFDGGKATVMPRLGFVFAPLEIHVDLDRRTGRIPPTFGGPETSSALDVRSNELGDRALFHLALALALRLSKRDFLDQGRSVVLNRQALDSLPGDKEKAEFVVSLPPLKEEPDLSKDSSVLREWAEMWACSEKTIKSPNFLHPKEFAKVYWMDRHGKTPQDVKRLPEEGFFTSAFESGEKIVTFVECPLTESATRKTQGNRAGFALGTAHTHPVDDPSQALPSSGDEELAKAGDCGRQHYIISERRIVAYFSNGSQKDLGDRKSKLPADVPCSQNIPEEVETI